MVLVPAALLIPAIAFFTICPPAYAKIGLTTLVTIFAASEIWGLVKLYGCVARKLDLATVTGVLCGAIGILVLAAIAWGVQPALQRIGVHVAKLLGGF